MAATHPGRLPAAEAGEAINGHEVAGGTTEVAAHGGEGGGLPQFRVEFWAGQIVWLLILFALLYVLLSRVFVPRIRRVLDLRASTIAASIEEARSVRAEADAQARAAEASMVDARGRAQRTAAEAKAASAAQAAEGQAAQEGELSQKLSVAEGRIRASRDQAMGQVRTVAADTVAAIVEKLTGQVGTRAEVESALADLADRSAPAAMGGR